MFDTTRSAGEHGHGRAAGIRWAAFAAVISGVAVYINKFGVEAWQAAGGAAGYTTAKNLVAACVLLVLLASQRGSRPAPNSPPRTIHRLGLVAVAVVGGSVPFLLFFEGLTRATSTQAAFLHKTLIIWVVLLAVPLLGERLGRLHILAIGLLVIGQLIVAGGIGDFSVGSGEILVLTATLLWAIEAVINKKLLASYSPRMLGTVRMAGGGVLLVAYSLSVGSLPSLSSLSGAQIGWTLVTGLVLSGYVLTWLTALSLAPAIDVTAMLVGGALITALLNGGLGVGSFELSPGLLMVAIGIGLVALAGRAEHSGSRVAS